MAFNDTKEMLCIPAGSRKYAVEFSYIEEICRDLEISCLPCVPEYFAGVCNYKGNIVPVVYLEGRPAVTEDGQEKQIIIIVSHEQYYMGILISQEPFLANVTNEDRIQGPDRQGEGLWVEKEYYISSENLYALIDVEESLGKLVICE